MNTKFNDLSDVLKAGLTLEDLYKLKGNTDFGTKLLPQNAQRRIEECNKQRKESRCNALLKRRNISSLSPYETPINSRKIKKENKPDMQGAMEERLAKLQQWKQMKMALKAKEKQRQKPPFKVGSAAAVVGKGIAGKVELKGEGTKPLVKVKSKVTEEQVTNVKKVETKKTCVDKIKQNVNNTKRTAVAETKLQCTKLKKHLHDQKESNSSQAAHRYGLRTRKVEEHKKPKEFNKTKENSANYEEMPAVPATEDKSAVESTSRKKKR